MRGGCKVKRGAWRQGAVKACRIRQVLGGQRGWSDPGLEQWPCGCGGVGTKLAIWNENGGNGHRGRE